MDPGKSNTACRICKEPAWSTGFGYGPRRSGPSFRRSWTGTAPEPSRAVPRQAPITVGVSASVVNVAPTVYCFGVPPLNVRTLERMPTARTSASSPLRVAAVAPGEGHGRIGITMCPGKTDPAGMSGPWARDLDTDLEAIRRWGATAVVSLITDEELDLLSVRGLPGAVRDSHMEWWHAPIPDGWPPGPEFEAAWAVAGEAVRDRLRRKRAI